MHIYKWIDKNWIFVTASATVQRWQIIGWKQPKSYWNLHRQRWSENGNCKRYWPYMCWDGDARSMWQWRNHIQMRYRGGRQTWTQIRWNCLSKKPQQQQQFVEKESTLTILIEKQKFIFWVWPSTEGFDFNWNAKAAWMWTMLNKYWFNIQIALAFQFK